MEFVEDDIDRAEGYVELPTGLCASSCVIFGRHYGACHEPDDLPTVLQRRRRRPPAEPPARAKPEKTMSFSESQALGGAQIYARLIAGDATAGTKLHPDMSGLPHLGSYGRNN
jgi:hypothetical protein